MVTEKININVEVDLELHKELRIMAIQEGIDFHNFIRVILQKAAEGKKRYKK